MARRKRIPKEGWDSGEPIATENADGVVTEQTPFDHARDKLVNIINAGMSPEVVYTLDMPLKQPILMENGTYKTASVPSGEYTFKNVRKGARDKRYIFSFRPVDAQPFKQVEFDESSLCVAFPSIEQSLCAEISLGNPELAAITGLDMPGERLKNVMGAFVWQHAKAITKAKKQTDMAAAEEKEKVYGGNPNWGAF
jgi:hypothetical protein